MDRVDELTPAEDSELKTTPAKQMSGGITRERKQADLKAMMEVEVGGAVFQSATVHRVFFVERQDLIDSIVPFNNRKVQNLVAALGKVTSEPQAYAPLTALFTFIVAQPADRSKRSKAQQSQKRHVSVFFMVYTKEMKTKVDGAGHLKPDVLNTKRPYDEDKPVPWVAVRIAIEVKSHWREGFRQALTYARSMLEVGDKWYALVLVYNHATQEVCFCFATRHGVFVSPRWSLTQARGYKLAADALLHACYATESEAGLDPNRCLNAAGTRFLRVPTFPSWIRLETELFASIQVLGRATHVYAAQADTTFQRPAEEPDRDPANFSQKFKEPSVAAAAGQVTPAARVGLRSRGPIVNPINLALPPIPLSFSPYTAPSDASTSSAPPATSFGTSQGAPALPGATGVPSAPTTTGTDGPSSSANNATWEALCLEGESSWAENAFPRLLKSSFVAKEAWVVSPRSDMEIKILRAVKGQWAHVEYAGHTIIAHPGMERLAQFRSPPAEGEPSRKCENWPDTILSGQEPVLHPREHRVIFYTPEGRDLVTICDKPDRVAHAMKDIATALLILHEKGFTHRDLSIWNVMAHDEVHKNAAGRQFLPALFGDRWDDFKHLFLEQHVFVIDFDHAVSWLEQRKLLPARSATWAFMAAARIKAWINKAPWIDTLIDDLESALWSLFYGTLKANLKRLSEIEKLHYESFESDNTYLLAATKHMFLAFRRDEVRGLSGLKATWPLWWRLVKVARRSRDEVTAIKDRLRPNETFATTSDENRKMLNEVCHTAVVGYIDAVKEALAEMAAAENEL